MKRNVLNLKQRVRIINWLNSNDCGIVASDWTIDDVLNALRKECDFPIEENNLKPILEACNIKLKRREYTPKKEVINANTKIQVALEVIANSLVDLYRKLGEQTPPALDNVAAELNEVRKIIQEQ